MKIINYISLFHIILFRRKTFISYATNMNFQKFKKNFLILINNINAIEYDGSNILAVYFNNKEFIFRKKFSFRKSKNDLSYKIKARYTNGFIEGYIYGIYFNLIYFIVIILPIILLIFKQKIVWEILTLYYLIADFVFNIVISINLKKYSTDFKNLIIKINNI